jgi:hypothetical protein
MEHGVGAKVVDGSKSLLTIPDVGARYGHGSHDFDGNGVVEAGRRVCDDHSYVETLSDSLVARTERGESTPPLGVVDVQGGGMDMTRACG